MNSQSLRRWITAAVVTVSNWPLVCAWAEVNADQIAKIQEAMPGEPMAKPGKERRLLVFSRTRGFRHSSIPVGLEMVRLLGEKTGAFTATITEDASYFEPEKLKEFDAVADAQHDRPGLQRGPRSVEGQPRQGRARQGR